MNELESCGKRGETSLIERSRKLQEDIDSSLDQLERMQKQGFIISSEKYGNIVVDIGKRVSCGFDAVKAKGCGAYVLWNPKQNSFFVTTLGEFSSDHSLRQGVDMRGRHMWAKPRDGQSLQVTLGEILSIMTDGNLQAGGKLQEYLQKESLDASYAGATIDKDYLTKKTMPEINPRLKGEESPEETEKAYEIAALEARDRPSAQAQAEKTPYTNKIELSNPSRKAVGDLLDEEMGALRQQYAEKWFDANKDKLTGIPVSKFGREAKIAFVLSNWKSVGENGPSPEADMRDNAAYKEMFGEEIDNLQALKTGLERPVSLASPFLLLNHLQTSIDRKTQELETVRQRAEAGDSAAKSDDMVLESRIKQLYAAAEELTGKVMKENLRGDAEKAVATDPNFKDKKTTVAEGLEVRDHLIKEKEEAELVDKELERFRREFSADQRKKLFPKIEEPPSAEDRSMPWYRVRFRDAMLERAADIGIEGPAFYELLRQGYKPYEATEKGWRKSKKRIVMPKPGGEPVDKSPDEFKDFVELAGKDREAIIKSKAEEQLGAEWDEAYAKKVAEKIRERVRQVAKSPEIAGDKLKELFAVERRKIVQPLIDRFLEKAPKSPEAQPTQEEEARGTAKKGAEAEPEGQKENGVERFIIPPKKYLKLIEDASADDRLNREGALADLNADLEHDTPVLSRYFKKELGVKRMTPSRLKKLLTGGSHREEYTRRCRSRSGLIAWFVGILNDITEGKINL